MTSFDLSDDEVVYLCQSNVKNGSNVLSLESSGRKVVRVAAHVVVKFGLGVTLQEANAQQLAYERVDQKVLRIPRVYRFFTRNESKLWSIGYMIMEYIGGITLEKASSDLLPRVVEALNMINSISSDYPGPISGGEAHGTLWSECGSGKAFRDTRDLESYLNERLAYSGTAIDLQDRALCLCHMDASPRNFMIDFEGRLCLLDWANAGFYPRYFELWSIDFAQYVMGENFGPDLLRLLTPTEEEVAEVRKLSLVYQYNSHCAV